MAWAEAQVQTKRKGSPGRAVLSCFLCVFHPCFSQSIPHGWHRQVPAENAQLIISTNNSGQAKCSLGPGIPLLPWDCMSEDVKTGKKKNKKKEKKENLEKSRYGFQMCPKPAQGWGPLGAGRCPAVVAQGELLALLDTPR